MLGLLLMLAVAALPAQGLRSFPEIVKLNGEGDGETVGGIPSLAIYQDKWKEFDREMRAKPLPAWFLAGGRGPPIRMVVGVFTELKEKLQAYRDVIRSTWMNHPLVCDIRGIHDPNTLCKVFVTFVVGKTLNWEEDVRTEPGLTVLPAIENMNCGKSQKWFDYVASRNWPATHVAKMDMDAFLDVQSLVASMESFSTACPHVYGGRPWSCKEDKRFCPPEHCGMPLDGDFFKYNASDPDCYSYMQGGFYFMSVGLARDISSANGWWAHQDCLAEDAVAGKAIWKHGMDLHMGTCVSVLNLTGTRAIWHPDGNNCWHNSTLDCFYKV
eukprot:CAMPEP_0171202654 /NCGR_PEP_ID=MMETSP0790-20130122/25115_1 /TAXON_ID=2925 /ORGANISM="Alexandrium catenella, Strain OF101" /LENGTH=325 /DNA_ID=CAMNT_0011668087 /DNA_START=62 /DNA_END=1039 /DNA_ORIENTATION=+